MDRNQDFKLDEEEIAFYLGWFQGFGLRTRLCERTNLNFYLVKICEEIDTIKATEPWPGPS